MQEGFGGILRGKMAGRHKACPYREQGQKTGGGLGEGHCRKAMSLPQELKNRYFYPLQMQCCA